MTHRFVLAFLAMSCAAGAATWYVDAGANGRNDGSSWTDAWTNTDKIVWSKVVPGDTLVFSGGTSGRSYSLLQFQKSGEPGKPITVRPSREAGRNGLVTIEGIKFSQYRNLEINGSRSDSFAVPASVTNLRQITNNIGLRLSTRTHHGLQGTRMENVKLLWTEVSYNGDPATPNYCGIYINASTSGGRIVGSEIGYCWIHHNSIDGINNNGASDPVQDWDNLVIHHSIIEDNVDDGIQVGTFGITVHHCYVGKKWTAGTAGHPDMLQHTFVAKGKYRTYNNIFFNTWNAWLYTTLTGVEGGECGDFYYYGNLCYNERDWIGVDKMNYAVHLAAWGPNGPVNRTTLTNVYILNNTIYNARGECLYVGNSDGKKGYELWRMDIANLVVKNNLIIHGGYRRLSGAITIDGPQSPTQGCFYDPSTCQVDYNVVSGVNTRIDYAGVTYPNGEAMALLTPFRNNSSLNPTLVSLDQYDFRLASTDVAARNRGENLSSLSSKLSGLDRDLYGNFRGLESGWDVGANEYAGPVDGGSGGGTGGGTGGGGTGTDGGGSGGDGGGTGSVALLTHLDFEGNFSNGVLADRSGNNNNAFRFGRTGTSTNWPVAASWTQGGQAGLFNWYRDGWSIYERSGDYAAITNVAPFLNLPKMTVMAWARYNPAYSGSWPEDQNATLVDAGYGYRGNWSLGRNYDNKSSFMVYTNDHFNSEVDISFPDSGGRNGDTKVFNHYAAVFSEGNVRLYFNGNYVGETNWPISQVTVRGPWIGIGCKTHNSEPSLNASADIYPNNGWMNGLIDDVRIYGSALSATQVQAAYREIAGGVAPVPPSAPVGLRVIE